jgi:thymidylate synthase ThyX
VDEQPDVITPGLVELEPEALRLYNETMAKTWEALEKLRSLDVLPEWRCYLLPNAVAVRFTESGDLLNLRHKHEMRLCYNAQEEIWRASLDEALQIREVHPRLGKFLLPPCGARSRAGAKPICPEGPRYCGVRVWKLDPVEYQRTI